MKKDIEKEVKEIMENKKEGCRREEKMIFWRKQAYILDSATLWEEIIWDHHNYELTGHSRYTKTHKLITKNY